jgi:hypothetical protein
LGDGYWYSAVAFLRGGVALVSEGGPSVTTLRMDAAAMGAMVCRAFGESGTIRLTGFTLTGTVSGVNAISVAFSDRLIVRECVIANIGSDSVTGRGIGCVSLDLEVYSCRFENIVGLSGAAILQTSGTLILEDSEFLNCREGAVVLQYDGAYPHAADLVARRCRFIGNGGTSGALGTNYPTVLVEDCWFESNQATPVPGALAASGVASDQVLRNCTFVNNSGGRGLAGAIHMSGWTVLVEGNTFWGSHVDIDWNSGASAAFFSNGNVVFRNNVVANSTGNQAVGLSTGAIDTSCNVFWDNPLGNTSGFQPDSTDLTADPMFCDTTAGDFHVNAASPCVPGNGNPSCTDLIGAWGQGCGTVAVEPSSWGRIKNSFRSGSEEAGR